MKIQNLVAVGVVLAILGVLAVPGAGTRRLEARLEARIAALQQSGLLSPPAELGPLARRVSAELAELCARSVSRDTYAMNGAAQRVRSGEGTDVDRQAAREWLEGGAELVARAESLLFDAQVREALDRGLRLYDETPRMMSSRNVVNLLVVDALLAAGEEGGTERAAERFALALDFAAAVDDRSMIAAMVRVGLENIVCRAVRVALSLPNVEPAELRTALEPRLERGMDAAYRSEVVRSDTWALASHAPGLAGIQPDAEGEEVMRYFLSQLDRLETEQLLARIPSPRFLEAWQGITALDDVRGIFYSVAPSMHQHLARRALLRVHLGLAEHRRRTGEWPHELAEAAPCFASGIPVDPHTGLSFCYQRTEQGALVGPAAICATLDREDWGLAETCGLALSL
jgi:hypothetical protein